MAELSSLDNRRKEVVASIQSAVSSVMGAVPSPFSSGRKRGRPAGSTNKTKGTRKRRTMSAKARKAIGDAQRKRWAAQKRGTKKPE